MSITTKNMTTVGGAMIGYDNLLTSASVASGDTSGTIDKALVKNTYERWRPTNVATVTRFALSADAEVDFVGIAGHNLSGQTIEIQYATTLLGSLTTIEEITPTSNDPIMITFDPLTVREIGIAATFANDKEIAVVYAGKMLEMPRPIYGGHGPINLQPETEYQSNMSESGQFLGRNIVRQGLRTTYSWTYLEPDFVRGDFSTFVNSARRYPFFIKWRPDKFSEVAFAYTERDIQIMNMGGAHGLMSATMRVKAHSDVL